MKTTVIIFSYNRPELLRKVIDMFKGRDYDLWVLDDGSPYPESLFEDVKYIRLEHTGKRGFADKWHDAFYICKESGSDRFLFLPDDFLNLDFKRLDYLTKRLKDKTYAINVYNCGRDSCWTAFKPSKAVIGGEELTRLGFVDCGFVCNRKTLEAIGYHMPYVSNSWHNRRDKSSGVGYTLSNLFLKKGIEMYTPCKTLVDHGEEGHESQMHPYGNPIKINQAFVLNLTERKDKYDKFSSQPFPFPVKRFPATKASPGWIGCRDSHFKMLEQIEGVTLIMEDDCLMLKDWSFVEMAMKQLPVDWDMLYLGSTLNQPLEQYSDNLYRLRGGWTTHGIIYNGRYAADFILKCRNRIQKIDVFYANVVQERFKCYITYPMAATQRAGYSDVINREVDYKVIEQRYKQYVG